MGLGNSRTNAGSQWNPVYNAFHRNFCCENETIQQLRELGSKDAPQKMQFLGAIKKVASPGAFKQNAKVAAKPHRLGRHQSKIVLNPDVLLYFKSPWTGANMHIQIYG